MTTWVLGILGSLIAACIYDLLRRILRRKEDLKENVQVVETSFAKTELKYAEDSELVQHKKAREKFKAELENALNKKKVRELKELCKKYGARPFSKLRKQELVQLLVESDGVLSHLPEHSTVENRKEAVAETVKTSWFNRITIVGTIITIVGTIIGAAGTTIGAISLYLVLYPPTKEMVHPSLIHSDAMKPFEDVEGAYNILILPFYPVRNCKIQDTEMEWAIRNRLMEMNRQEGLNLQVEVYEAVECLGGDYEKGRAIGKRLNADLVVWGDYYEVCSATELDACVRYAVVNQVCGIDKEGKSETEKLRLSEIQEGKLQGDIDFIILWSLGMREYERHKYQEALYYFEGINNKKNGRLYVAIALCYHMLDDYESSLTQLTNYINLNAQDYIFPFKLRGDTYRYLMQFNRALADYDEAIHLNPQDPQIFRSRGLAYYVLKQYDNALADFDEAIRLHPQYDDALFYRGNAYYTLQQHEKALADFNEAIRLNPQNGPAFSMRGHTYRTLQQYDKAVADFSEAIRLNPQDANAFTNRGHTYRDLQQYDKAVADFSEVIRLKPQDANAFANRGHIYSSLNQKKNALADFNEAVLLNPREANEFNNRGLTYRDLNQYDKALIDFSEAIRLNPHISVAFFNRGNTYRILKQYDKALADYHEVICLHPHALTYLSAARTYSLMENLEEAIIMLRRAFELDQSLIEYANNEYDFINIRSTPEYKSLMLKFMSKKAVRFR